MSPATSEGTASLLAKPPATAWYRTMSGRTLLVHGILHLVLLALGFTFIMPLLWVVSTSLKPRNAIFSYPIQWIPQEPEWANYRAIFEVIKIVGRSALPIFAQNTAIIATTASLGTVLSATLVAYSLARLEWPGRDLVFTFAVGTMMLPGVVILVPSFLIFRTIGWVDTFLPLIVPSWLGGGGFYIFLTRQFLLGLPIELDEAARIDGAGSLRILLQVLLPLCQPVIAAVSIFAFLSHYNDFMAPLIYLNSNDKYTLALGLRWLTGPFSERWELAMAVSALMLLPVIVIFFVAQRYFIRGIQLSGLAGR